MKNINQLRNKFSPLRYVLALTILAVFSLEALAQNNPEADAGVDFTACENNVIVNGNAENYETIEWTTNGDGTFLNPSDLSTQYFPGSNDLTSQMAEVCLTAFANGSQATDCVNVTLQLIPTVDLNVDEITLCYYDSYTFNAVDVQNYSIVQWFTTNGGGGFDNENILNPTYFPSPLVDYSQGCVEIGILVQGQNPCQTFEQDVMNICFVPNAEANLGGDIHYACYGEDYTFNDATASGYSALQWFTFTGGGYFENPNDINATYVPNPEFDYPQGCIFVSLTGQPISPCTTGFEEYAQICFAPSPEADAGPGGNILYNETFSPEALVEGAESILWESSGNGSFDDPTLLNATYTPGSEDLQNGSVVLSLNAFSENCSSPANDELTLTILTMQDIDLPQGSTGFSTYVNTEGLSFEEIIAPISDDLIFAQHFSQIYWPEFNINTLGDLSEGKGLKLVLNGPANLPLAGNLNDLSVNLSAGWNLLPVPVFCDVDAQELINQLGNNLIIVTEVSGTQVLYPDGDLYTLDKLVPGKAYYIKISNPAQFVFPYCE